MHKLMRICLHLPTCSNINKFLHAASKCRCLYTRIPYCASFFFLLACQNFAASIWQIWKNGKLQTCRIATKSPRLKYQAGGASECQGGWCCHTQWVHLRRIDFIAYWNTAQVAGLSASIRAFLRLQFGRRKSSSLVSEHHADGRHILLLKVFEVPLVATFWSPNDPLWVPWLNRRWTMSSCNEETDIRTLMLNTASSQDALPRWTLQEHQLRASRGLHLELRGLNGFGLTTRVEKLQIRHFQTHEPTKGASQVGRASTMEDDLLLPKLLRALDLLRNKRFRIRHGGLPTGVPVPVLGDLVLKCAESLV